MNGALPLANRLSRRIWQLIKFSPAGTLGQRAGEAVLSRKLPAGIHCQAGRGERQKLEKLFHFSADHHQIWHPWHWCPSTTSQHFCSGQNDPCFRRPIYHTNSFIIIYTWRHDAAIIASVRSHWGIYFDALGKLKQFCACHQVLIIAMILMGYNWN